MTQEQYCKLDNCYFKFSMDDRCVEEVVEARTLLGSHRFDLYGILFYIDQKVKKVADLGLAKDVYLERTRAMTGFRLAEIGNENKASFDDFLHVLDHLISDFQDGTYDDSKTLIPVDKKGEPIDGAHRISCAAYFNRKVRVLRFLDREVTPYNHEYLKREMLPSGIGDWMALEALRWHDDVYALFLWPKAFRNTRKFQKALQMISAHADVLYQVQYRLTHGSIRNLMIQLYGHMDWVGSIDDGYANITGKVDEVWDENGKVHVVLIRAESSADVLELKSKIRDLFGIGLASVHSTDNIRETKMAMNALLNPNSRHFLQHANVTRYKKSFKIFSRFSDILEKEGFDTDEFIVDSSMVLSMYGLRPAADLDYVCLHNDEKRHFPSDESIEEHLEDQRIFYSVPARDLINNPEHYFVFNGIKFLSLRNLLLLKQIRYAKFHVSKHAEDIRMIQAVLKDDGKFRQQFYRICVMFKRRNRLFKQSAYVALVTFSKKMHVYELLRKAKRLLKG